MIAVTAATSQLGRLVIDALIARGVDASGIVAVARNPAKAQTLPHGVVARRGDYKDIESMRVALHGVTSALVISGSVPGARVEQHANAIDAALLAGVGFLAYTSVLRAREATLSPVAPDHAVTERYLEETQAPAVVLRNGFYTENYLLRATPAMATGELITSAGYGRTASASRADFAHAAAAVLTTDGHAGNRYELTGDTAWTMDELGAVLARIAGRPIAVRHVEPAEHVAMLVSAGVKPPIAQMTADIDRACAAGEYEVTTHDLARLTGRGTTPMAATLEAILAGAGR